MMNVLPFWISCIQACNLSSEYAAACIFLRCPRIPDVTYDVSATLATPMLDVVRLWNSAS